MEFRSVTPAEYESVRQFLAEVGWQHRVSNPEQFRRMMEKTDRTIVAWDDSRIVGFARALCDGVSNGYISMVAVAADRRGKGIGRKLVEALTKDDLNITGYCVLAEEAKDSGKRLGLKDRRLQWSV